MHDTEKGSSSADISTTSAQTSEEVPYIGVETKAGPAGDNNTESLSTKG